MLILRNNNFRRNNKALVCLIKRGTHIVGPISYIVELQCAGKACQEQTLWLIQPIRKLRRKLNVVNLALIRMSSIAQVQ
jgi:hypothetical protein